MSKSMSSKVIKKEKKKKEKIGDFNAIFRVLPGSQEEVRHELEREDIMALGKPRAEMSGNLIFIQLWKIHTLHLVAVLYHLISVCFNGETCGRLP